MEDLHQVLCRRRRHDRCGQGLQILCRARHRRGYRPHRHLGGQRHHERVHQAHALSRRLLPGHLRLGDRPHRVVEHAPAHRRRR